MPSVHTVIYTHTLYTHQNNNKLDGEEHIRNPDTQEVWEGGSEVQWNLCLQMSAWPWNFHLKHQITQCAKIQANMSWEETTQKVTLEGKDNRSMT